MPIIQRRAAFDIGSAQIKMQVSDVNLATNTIVNALLIDFAIVPLRESISKSKDGRLTENVQRQVVDAIEALLQKSSEFSPTSFHAVATEGLRLAKNSDDLVKRIKEETDLSVTIISQEEEGILGFASAVHEAGVDPEIAVAWDFGGGSFQLTAKDQDTHTVYKGRLGKVPMKNAVLKIQGKDLEKIVSPNPISRAEADLVIQHIQEILSEVPEKLRQKIKQPDVVVLSVGINPLWGLEESARFDRVRIEKELRTRLDLDDEALIRKDDLQSQVSPYRVSNLLLVHGVMKGLDISHVHYVGTQGANAVGLLLSPQYWQMK
jgi:exopolyphosphatase/guanosine-5'-triphosphate,3'-diphosphate pyrophosphatase